MRARLAPPTLGRGVYRYAPPSGVARLAVHSSGRYFTQNGQPFRLQTEAVWNMAVQCSTTDLATYFTDRKARGFNCAMIMNLVDATFNGPANFNGVQPFSTTDHFDTPNAAYFDYIDTIIDTAASYGFYVKIAYCYSGFNGTQDGWYTRLTNSNNTQTVCYNFGLYLGNRWKNKNNVILMHSGDYTIPSGEGRLRSHQLLQGLRDAGCFQLCGFEIDSPDTTGPEQGGFTFGADPTTSDLNMYSCYGYGAALNTHTYDTADTAWNNSPTLPAEMTEPPYDYSGQYGDLGHDVIVRKVQWWFATAGGIAGSTLGVQCWQFPTGWQSLLGETPVLHQQNLFAFFKTFAWQLHRPSGTAAGYAGRVLVVSGGGSGDSKVTSSIASDGSSLIVYVPPVGSGTQTFSVDLRSMSGTGNAKWFDPTNGTYTNIADYANSLSSQSFTTPGNNSAGDNDWVLRVLV